MAMQTTSKLLPSARQLVKNRRPAIFQRNLVHARRAFDATILTKRLENAGVSSMVGAVAMETTSKLRQNARQLVRNCRPAIFQMNPVYARRAFDATILTKRLENAGVSSMVGAVAMQTTSKLRQNARQLVKNCRPVIYYFDEAAGKCRLFIYDGVGGNANNFKTKAECNKECH